MKEQFARNIGIIGIEGQEKLFDKKVIVFGLGGVGGYVVEALTRAGVGQIDIVDKDIVDVTNLNRQIIATHNTLGLPKVECMKERMKSINKDIVCNSFYKPYEHDMVDFSDYDYVVDAIDDVKAKIDIIVSAKEKGVKVISSMGTGNKLDPTKFLVDDISKTSVCPLARVIRKELKLKDITDVKVIYSKEEPIKTGRVSSISFVPSVAGLIIAGEVIKDLI